MTIRLVIGFFMVSAIGQPGFVAAQELAAPSRAATTMDQVATSPFGAAKPIDNASLHTITGQGNLAQVVNAQNKGVVSGNTISGPSQTGTIHFDSSSFQNLNGLSLLSANTGNNVSINSSLNVNVAVSSR